MVREKSSSDSAQKQSGHHRRASPIRITATVNTREEQMEMLYASRRSWATRAQLPLEAVAIGEACPEAIEDQLAAPGNGGAEGAAVRRSSELVTEPGP